MRVVVKTGLVSRRTKEINFTRIESVNVDQSVLGRMLGYGTVAVQGTGGGIAPLAYVSDPLTLRRHLLSAPPLTEEAVAHQLAT
ncbi:MAG: PH domain-containing protein [Pirellulaceae bacterium]